MHAMLATRRARNPSCSTMLTRLYHLAGPFIEPPACLIRPKRCPCTLLDALLYCYYAGSVQLARRRHAQALWFFHVAITLPAVSASAVALAATKKWILLSVLCHGEEICGWSLRACFLAGECGCMACLSFWLGGGVGRMPFELCEPVLSYLPPSCARSPYSGTVPTLPKAVPNIMNHTIRAECASYWEAAKKLASKNPPRALAGDLASFAGVAAQVLVKGGGE